MNQATDAIVALYHIASQEYRERDAVRKAEKPKGTPADPEEWEAAMAMQWLQKLAKAEDSNPGSLAARVDKLSRPQQAIAYRTGLVW